eukprot:1337421-Pyramimonas_sp.AAC.1
MGASAGCRGTPPTTATGASAWGFTVQQVPGKTISPGSYSLRTARRRTWAEGTADGSASAAG